jgi:5-methylcytosine-specific restriction endonuclease McrA
MPGRKSSGTRRVFKFKLRMVAEEEQTSAGDPKEVPLEHDRLIPPAVKLEVWARDKGRCVLCGSSDNIHFDHVIPYSKGGSSLVAENIQLLCARHNLAKRDRIE